MIVNRYARYLETLKSRTGYRKLVRLDFLQPDGSVAFSLGNSYRRGYMTAHDSRAFVQSGTLNVSLQNGQRRRASVKLVNLDDAFGYNVNNIWFGRQVRLLMGLTLPDGSDFYLPQGVFYIKDPQADIQPDARTVTFPLVDKWSYLDGSLFGTLEGNYSVSAGQNIFGQIRTILGLSRVTLASAATDPQQQLDSAEPVFTDYYNGKTYEAVNSDGSVTQDIPMLQTPYAIREPSGGTFANLILTLNDLIVGIIGYDQTGALRVDASQDDVTDGEKSVLWSFTPENSQLFGISETLKNSEVCNQVLVVGEGNSGEVVWASAENYDPASDTNINLIGRRAYRLEGANFWNTDQCVDLAVWNLKRKTILRKAVSIQCQQMFHLIENGLVSIVRTDKPGSPVEKHVIQSFSIPLSETGAMSITAVSANDIPQFTATTSSGTA